MGDPDWQSNDFIELRNGVYRYDSDAHLQLNIRGFSPQAVIECYRPILVSYHSMIERVTLKAMGDFPCVILDKCSYAHFREVWFAPNLPDQLHVGKKSWEELQHKGTGVQTTTENDGDNTYKVMFDDCVFSFFDVGVDVVAPRIKGTLQWRFFDCVWNSCRYPILARRAAEWKVLYGVMQLAELGIDIDGNFNRIVGTHFERNESDIRIQPGGIGNQLLWTDAIKEKITAGGAQTVVRYGHNRNISRPTEEP